MYINIYFNISLNTSTENTRKCDTLSLKEKKILHIYSNKYFFIYKCHYYYFKVLKYNILVKFLNAMKSPPPIQFYTTL